MYPEEMCAPMRKDLTNVGYKELRTANQVEELLASQKGIGKTSALKRVP